MAMLLWKTGPVEKKILPRFSQSKPLLNKKFKKGEFLKCSKAKEEEKAVKMRCFLVLSSYLRVGPGFWGEFG